MLLMNPIRVLCFGDSITAGFVRWDKEYHPYAWKMLGLLKESLPSAKVTTDIQGASGDQVVTPPGGYLTRMDILYEEKQTPYDWAIVLGGTNDLVVGRSAVDIWTGLKKVYEIPLSHNTKVLALTVPECGSCSRDYNSRRMKLNPYILNHQAENYYTFDLSKSLPYNSLSDEEREELWSDGMHPTEKGYDLMGRVFAKRLLELIGETNSSEDGQENARTELKARDATISGGGSGRVLRSSKNAK